MTIANQIVVILPLIILGFNPADGQVRSDRESANLKGPVKTLLVKRGHFVSHDGGYDEKCCSFVRSVTYDKNGATVTAESSDVPIDGGPRASRTIKTQYDGKGNLVEEASYDPDGSLFSRTVYSYDTAGNRAQAALYSATGALYRREVFRYNASRNLIEHTVYYGDGTPSYKQTYSDYDAQDNWSKEIRWVWETKDGKSYWEPFTVTYRTITYY